MSSIETRDRDIALKEQGETIHYGRAWAKRLLGEHALERDDSGYGNHPDIPTFDCVDLASKFFGIFGLELVTRFAESELDDERYLQLTHTNDCAIWTPQSPEGSAWTLVSIFDTEDGPAAWWLRQKPETCEISQTQCVNVGRLRHEYPLLPVGSEVIQFTSDAVVYTDADMRAYVDADRLLRPFHTALDQFFSFNQEQGMKLHHSAFEAQGCAQRSIQQQKVLGWTDTVKEICWGVVRQKAVIKPDPEYRATGQNKPDASQTVEFTLQDPMGDEAEEASTLIQLAKTRESRVYIAGPMTGIQDFNYPAFNEVANQLRAAGWHVENPAEHGVVEGAEWADYLHYDLGRLATCSALYLLPGWETSRGAILEFHVANTLGMTIGYHHGAEKHAPNDVQDPLETPLPCEIKIGNITLRKGVALRLLVTRSKQLFEMATGQSADAVANQSIEDRQRKLLALQTAVGAVVEPSGMQPITEADCTCTILIPPLEKLQDIATLRQRAATGEEFNPIEAFAHAHEPDQGNAEWRADLFDLLRHYAERGNVHPGAINNAQFTQWWHKHMLWTPADDGFEAWKDAVNTGICASALSGLSVTSEKHVQPTLEALIGLAIAAHQINIGSMVDDKHDSDHVSVPISSLETLGTALDALHVLPHSPGKPNQLPADKAAWALRDLLGVKDATSRHTLTLQR